MVLLLDVPLILGLLPPLEARVQPVARLEGDRGRRHRERHHDDQYVGRALVHEQGRHTDGENHEGELAALRECHGRTADGPPVRRVDARDGAQTQHLDEHETDGEAENGERRLDHESDVDGHADRHEEQAEKQALEGIDIGLQLVPVLGLGEQHARQERAERHREADKIHQQRHTDDREEGRGREDLVGAELRHQPQDVAQQIVSAEDHECDHAHRLDDADPQRPAFGARGRGRQQRQKGQHRDHRDVLEEQDGKGEASMAGRKLVAFGQRLQAKGGRRQRQGEPRDDRGLERQPERHGDAGEHDGGQRNLPAAQPEHRPAHGPEAPRLEFEADDEQQQNDAELGEVKDRLLVVDQVQRPRPHDHPRQHVAQHRAQSGPLGQRDDDHGGGEKDRNLSEKRH